MKFNENPLYLLLDPNTDKESQDLPVTMYESEIHIQNGNIKYFIII